MKSTLRGGAQKPTKDKASEADTDTAERLMEKGHTEFSYRGV